MENDGVGEEEKKGLDLAKASVSHEGATLCPQQKFYGSRVTIHNQSYYRNMLPSEPGVGWKEARARGRTLVHNTRSTSATSEMPEVTASCPVSRGTPETGAHAI